MASFKLGEVIVDAIVAKLRANLAGRVEAVNLEKSDGLTIQAPGDLDYYTSGVTSLPAAPAVIVAEAPSTFRREGGGGLISHTDVNVWILDQDVDRQSLGRRLQRLSRAVIECLFLDEPAQALTGSAFTLYPLGTTPGKVFEPQSSDEFRGFYLVTFRAEQLEG